MILNKIGYSYNDVTIIPSIFTGINSRSECDVNEKNGYLPIFTAPMSAIVDETNYFSFNSCGIIPIVPRNIKIGKRLEIGKLGYWIAVSLNEFNDLFTVSNTVGTGIQHVCLDIANGHMESLLYICKVAKLRYPKLKIMIGNIANPETFKAITDYNKEVTYIDYVRVSIGTGAGCITSSNTGIHYPIASLIDECNKFKTEYSPKLIADGGIRNYSDVVKALALGADYVMIGSLLAQCEESAGEKIETVNGEKLVKFYGMASADGQIAINGKKTKTAEGITKMLPVKYSIRQWSENMIHYLKSAMSYCNAFTLDDFIGKQNLIINANINSINK